MPVRKFRSVEEMEDAVWLDRNDPRLHRAIAAVWDFAERTVPRRFPPGVYKHATLESAQRLREVWADADFRRFQELRRRQVDPGGAPREPSPAEPPGADVGPDRGVEPSDGGDGGL